MHLPEAKCACPLPHGVASWCAVVKMSSEEREEHCLAFTSHSAKTDRLREQKLRAMGVRVPRRRSVPTAAVGLSV